MKKTQRLLALCAATALAATACGGGDDLSSEDAELATALAAHWESEGEFPEEIDITCAAEGFVAGAGGASSISEYGITAENIGFDDFDDTPLSEEHARGAAKGFLDCDGFKSSFVGAMADAGDDEQKKCLAEAIKDEHLEALLASTFMGEAGSALEAQFENDFEKDLFEAFVTCEIEL